MTSKRTVLASILVAAASTVAAQTVEKMEGSEALVGLRGLIVPPVARTETTNLIDAGSIETDGYTHMTLNLAAELKGIPGKRGVIGVLLLPDVEPFRRAWRTLGLVLATVDFTAGATLEAGAYLMAAQQTFEVGFPRYRVLLYNTTGTSATVAFFAYRTRR
ncbi:MAG: hypothetical protein WAU32_13690 [Thermoanaerobaculia bacterium]